MPGLADLQAALAAPRPILMDGAMGTELTRRGHPLGSAEWAASTLDLSGYVAALHDAYAKAGARLHIANTFGASRHVLKSLGQESRFEAVNRAAVQVCCDSIGTGWIAGSISTYVVGSDRANLPRGARLAGDVGDQAMILADAGCDLIALEMLFDVDTTCEMIGGVAGTGLPVSIGLTCVRGPDGEIYLRGEYTQRLSRELLLDDALPQILAVVPDGAILTIMHSQFPETTDALAIVRKHWDGPIGVYPNSGRFVPPDGWEDDGDCTPTEFTKHALEWREAAFVGGCCGIGPKHIAALNAALEETHG